MIKKKDYFQCAFLYFYKKKKVFSMKREMSQLKRQNGEALILLISFDQIKFFFLLFNTTDDV